MQQILSMVLRLFMGRAINHGIGLLARRGKDAGAMTAEEKAGAAQTKQSARQARQAIRLMRRMGR